MRSSPRSTTIRRCPIAINTRPTMGSATCSAGRPRPASQARPSAPLATEADLDGVDHSGQETQLLGPRRGFGRGLMLVMAVGGQPPDLRRGVICLHPYREAGRLHLRAVIVVVLDRLAKK